MWRATLHQAKPWHCYIVGPLPSASAGPSAGSRDAKIGFVVDIWSPGRDKLGDKATPGQAALVAAVAKLSSTPERFAGGHGTVADYAPLASLIEASYLEPIVLFE